MRMRQKNGKRVTAESRSYVYPFSIPYGRLGAPPWSSGSVLDHRSLPPVFESRRGHIWRLFRLSLRLITFGCRSAHLAYHVHKSGRKTSIIILMGDCVCDFRMRQNGWLHVAIRENGNANWTDVSWMLRPRRAFPRKISQKVGGVRKHMDTAMSHTHCIRLSHYTYCVYRISALMSVC